MCLRSFLCLRFEAVALCDEPAFDPGAAAFLLLRGDPAPAGSALAARSVGGEVLFEQEVLFPLLLRIRQHSHPVAEAAVERILAHSDLARPVRYSRLERFHSRSRKKT